RITANSEPAGVSVKSASLPPPVLTTGCRRSAGAQWRPSPVVNSSTAGAALIRGHVGAPVDHPGSPRHPPRQAHRLERAEAPVGADGADVDALGLEGVR